LRKEKEKAKEEMMENVPWYQFFFGDPDTNRASGRKIILYTFCIGLVFILVKTGLMIKTLEDFTQIFPIIMTAVGAIIGFYFGKNGLPKLPKP
jgi:hypothetical protein